MHAPKSWNMYFLHCILVLLTCVLFAAFSLNVSLSYTTRLMLKAHARPCYTIMSIINAQISLVPRLPLSFLLVLPVMKRLPLNLCIHSLAKQLKNTAFIGVLSSNVVLGTPYSVAGSLVSPKSILDFMLTICTYTYSYCPSPKSSPRT